MLLLLLAVVAVFAPDPAAQFVWDDVELIGNNAFVTDWANLPTIVWVTLGYTAIFASAVSIVLLQFASLRLPASKVMAYTYLTPTWVIGWEFFLGNGLPTVFVLGGVMLTVLALGLLLKDEG